jgi:predicted secreted protein
MATKAVTTKALKLKRGDAATPTEAFTVIAEITNIAGPDESAAQIEATSFDSTAKEFIAALADSGEVSFDMNFIGDDAQQQGLRSDLRAGTKRNFKLIIPDRTLEASCSTCSFAAIVTSLSGPQGGNDEKITQSCTLKVSGTPNWVYATGA